MDFFFEWISFSYSWILYRVASNEATAYRILAATATLYLPGRQIVIHLFWVAVYHRKNKFLWILEVLFCFLRFLFDYRNRTNILYYVCFLYVINTKSRPFLFCNNTHLPHFLISFWSWSDSFPIWCWVEFHKDTLFGNIYQDYISKTNLEY